MKRAGIIPYYWDEYGDLYMLFMVPSDSNFGGVYPQIAKGVIDRGETPLEAAFREGQEELGLIYENTSGPIFHAYTSKKINLEVYAVHIIDPDDFAEPHFETGYTIWLADFQIKHSLRSIHQVPVYNVIRKINASL